MENKQEAHYRIIVERVGEESEEYKLPLELTKEGGGIACNGFVILADMDDGHQSVVQHMTTIGIASIMSETHSMLAAATLAKAMDEANAIQRDAEIHDGMKRFLGGLKNRKEKA